METRLLQQLELTDPGETKQLIDETGVLAHSNAPAGILVVIDEGHPALIILLPGDLVRRRPVKPIRSVGLAVSGVPAHQGRQRVLVMTFCTLLPHEVTA